MKTRRAKTYKILTKNVKVQYRDAVYDENDEWIYGKIEHKGQDATIIISTKNEEGIDLTDEIIEVTLRHELFHLILDILYFRDLSANETLVEWLANATMQLHKQGLTI